MRKLLVIVLVASCALSLSAQEVIDFSPATGVLSDSLPMQDQRPQQTRFNPQQTDFKPQQSYIRHPDDSLALALPPLTYRGTIARYPYWGSLLYGYNDWSLHRGLNASLTAAAIFGFGHNAGTGFANSLSVMYADNITPKLSFAIGGYASFFDYAGRQMKDAGLTAMLNYRFDEHWEAALFAQKSVLQPNVPPHLYWMSDVGDKIGAAVHYHFNPSLSIGLSVWHESYPRHSYAPMPYTH